MTECVSRREMRQDWSAMPRFLQSGLPMVDGETNLGPVCVTEGSAPRPPAFSALSHQHGMEGKPSCGFGRAAWFCTVSGVLRTIVSSNAVPLSSCYWSNAQHVGGAGAEPLRSLAGFGC
jgi:hypothetical protein